MTKVQIAIILISIIAMSSAYIISRTFVDENEIETIYKSIDEFVEKNPNVKLIPMNVDAAYNVTRSYTLGQRQTGDVVVANTSNKRKWPQAQNVTTTLTYPTSGQGAFLTYILINCEQSSQIGQAYVSYGGIHQHFIQIIIEARVTSFFNYAAFFYGIK